MRPLNLQLSPKIVCKALIKWRNPHQSVQNPNSLPPCQNLWQWMVHMWYISSWVTCAFTHHRMSRECGAEHPCFLPIPHLRSSFIPAGIRRWLSPLRLLQSFISLSCSEGLKRTGVITGTKGYKMKAQGERKKKDTEEPTGQTHTLLSMHLAARKKCHSSSVIHWDVWPHIPGR